MMEYQVVIEYDPGTKHYTATVPALGNVFVDAKSEQGVIRMARKAIRMALEHEQPPGERRPQRARSIRAKIVSVDV